MPNENGKSVWREHSWPIILLAGITGTGGLTVYSGNENIARLEQRMESHLESHPDTDLARRIDRIELRMDRQSAHIRDLERRVYEHSRNEE